MLAVRGVVRLAVCARERGGGEDLDVETVRVRVAEDVRRVVAVALLVARDDFVDDGRIHERAVGRDADDRVGRRRSRRLGGALETVEHVGLVAAEEGEAALLAEGSDGVVGGGGARRDDDRVDVLGGFDAVDDADEHRLTGDVEQHLSGQARRAHARLDDGDDLGPLRAHRRRTPFTLGCAEGLEIRGFERSQASFA
ncbi:MAG: hypothetical protein QM702_21325 [Rubrivivax sp.]